MKEKDLDKNLDKIIIEGLIKEAEQDSADFAVAMRKISDKDFEAIVRESGLRTHKKKKMNFRRFRPWLISAISAAAVILIVLIPSFNSMNARLCDSALYMSEVYITPAKGGFDVSTATDEQIRKELPALEERYEASIVMDGESTTYTADFKDAGWTLAVAYLKLHKKGDAVRVLKTLESQTNGTLFGDHCAKLLRQLE